MLIDTHCHLSFKAFNDSWLEVVKRARAKGVQMICVGAARATSEKAIAIAEQSDGVFAAAGLHPTHVEDEQFDYDWFSKAADNPKVVAIGETGIDYYHLPPHPTLSPQGGRGDKESNTLILKKHEDLLRQHLTLARDKNLPVILHCRDAPTTPPPAFVSLRETGLRPSPSSKRRGYNTAYDHLYQIIKDFGYFRCVLHCFGSNWTIAQKFLDLGCLISFTGIVTYKNASPKPSPSPSPPYQSLPRTRFGVRGRLLKGEGINTKVPSSLWGEGVRGGLHEVVRHVPLDRFILETDSPYLAPEPHRGKQNEPAYVEHIARVIAQIRGVSYEKIAEATSENARKFFKI